MQHINLIPQDLQKKLKRKWALKDFFVEHPSIKAAIFLVIVFGGLYCYQFLSAVKISAVVAAKKNKIAVLEKELNKQLCQQAVIEQEKENLTKQNDYLSKRFSFLEQTIQEKTRWSKIIAVLAELAPQQITLVKISLDKNTVVVNGVAPDNLLVSDFLAGIDQSAYFSAANFTFTQQAKQENELKGVDFEITGIIK
jgi:Tfp pilus assembly protein PilN